MPQGRSHSPDDSQPSPRSDWAGDRPDSSPTLPIHPLSWKDRKQGVIMQGGWRVGSLFGIPLFIDPSWFLILAFLIYANGNVWQDKYPDWGWVLTYGAAAAMAILLFASVLLHELGHSLVARSQGIKVNSITLFLFGGVASIEQESKTPGQAFQVAIAGPAVSLALCGLLAVLLIAVPNQTNPVRVMAINLASINLFLGLFNLLPGLPLDGGQILKAAVWKATGSRFKGVHWAARTGKALGWLAILFGILTFVGGVSSGLWIGLIGWFVLQNASSYDRLTELQEALLSLKAADAMTREFRVVDAEMSLRRFADDYLLGNTKSDVYYASSDGRYRGMVMTDDLHYVERSEWEMQKLYRIIHPLAEIPSVEEASPLVDAIQQMESRQLRRMTVLSPAGAVSGVIDRGDIVRALAGKLKMTVSDSLIKQIKDEGAYPPGFQLGAIAQAAVLASDTKA
ncbi:MAG: site-2 protease family protein [Leptolyngbyaceae cyanobacterium bins.349]|nr:site-2 protease family protein [Leptolyngbyaceae cyanobacterium bins.349]